MTSVLPHQKFNIKSSSRSVMYQIFLQQFQIISCLDVSHQSYQIGSRSTFSYPGNCFFSLLQRKHSEFLQGHTDLLIFQHSVFFPQQSVKTEFDHLELKTNKQKNGTITFLQTNFLAHSVETLICKVLHVSANRCMTIVVYCENRKEEVLRSEVKLPLFLE